MSDTPRRIAALVAEYRRLHRDVLAGRGDLDAHQRREAEIDRELHHLGTSLPKALETRAR